MVKRNFATVEKLREAIIEQHKKEPNVVMLINDNAIMALKELNKKSLRSIAIMKQCKRRVKILAIEYDGKLHYFCDSKERFLFML